MLYPNLSIVLFVMISESLMNDMLTSPSSSSFSARSSVFVHELVLSMEKRASRIRAIEPRAHVWSLRSVSLEVKCIMIVDNLRIDDFFWQPGF